MVDPGAPSAFLQVRERETERSSRLLQMGMCWASPSTPSLVAACSGLSHVTTGVETFCETQHPATQRISLKESKRLKLSNALFAQ